MKIVYIAHPIGGDVKNNLREVCEIIRVINLTMHDILPFAHYVTDCYSLHDDDPKERARGMQNDLALLGAGFIDEMWLFGDRITTGMQTEINLARELNIPVFSKSSRIIL